MERKLAAIFAADVVGYSRLIRAEEEGTLEALSVLRRDIIDPAISAHNGRTVKLMGDGILAEFPSVVRAVSCAAEIQMSMSNSQAHSKRLGQITFRIGVHIGDVVIDGDDIQGDGVNLAARLESLSDPGGICISDAVHDQVRDRLNLKFVDAGLKLVKNIDRPVHVWKWTAFSTGKSQTLNYRQEDQSFSNKPSIAVLPFENMSTDPDQEFFSDGITNDIITDLSRVSGLFVIARKSTFTYKGKSVDVKQAGQELGVQYVVEGSVRRSASKVRINAQLINASVGTHVWAERYDRDLEDIFELQDEITENIVAALAVKLTQTEQERAFRKQSGDLRAYDYVLRGDAYHHRMTKDDNARAIEMYKRAIELEPNNASAHAGIAWSLVHDSNQGWSDDAEASLQLGFMHARRSVELDDGLAKAHMVLGDVHCWNRRHEQAVAEGRIAISLEPSFADGHYALAFFLLTAGQAIEALHEVEKALKLNPLHPKDAYHRLLGVCHYMLGQYKAAAAAGEIAMSRNPKSRVPFLLAATYAQLGQMKEAKQHANAALKIDPNFTIREYRRSSPYKNSSYIDLYCEGWRRAGLPE